MHTRYHITYIPGITLPVHTRGGCAYMSVLCMYVLLLYRAERCEYMSVLQQYHDCMIRTAVQSSRGDRELEGQGKIDTYVPAVRL